MNPAPTSMSALRSLAVGACLAFSTLLCSMKASAQGSGTDITLTTSTLTYDISCHLQAGKPDSIVFASQHQQGPYQVWLADVNFASDHTVVAKNLTYSSVTQGYSIQSGLFYSDGTTHQLGYVYGSKASTTYPAASMDGMGNLTYYQTTYTTTITNTKTLGVNSYTASALTSVLSNAASDSRSFGVYDPH